MEYAGRIDKIAEFSEIAASANIPVVLAKARNTALKKPRCGGFLSWLTWKRVPDQRTVILYKCYNFGNSSSQQ